jgi:YegS/Rv2252/BmrU family lipid kinase
MSQDVGQRIESYPDEPVDSQPVERGEAAYKRICVIINPAAGQDRPILGTMNKAFQGAGIDWDVFLTKQQGDAYRFARDAIANEVNAVAVYGGDGTVMEVANALSETDVPLAIFPGGTANVMSVELGIPSDLAEALALVSGDAGTIRTIDMGTVRSQKFLLRLGIGFWAEITKNAARESKNQMGNLAYILSALQQLTRTENASYRLILDGQEVEAAGVACMIANSGNIGVPGLKLSKTIDVSDGLLDVVIIRAADVGSLLSLAANAIGVLDNLPHWQAREISLESDPPQSIECDGEILEPTPVTVTVVPQSLKVIVPRSAAPPA